tara:strand:- start:2248 stop:3036 length:789 start_codon:yes stop_codon:yes gene_type:complete
MSFLSSLGGIGQHLEAMVDTDPTLGTCSPTEAHIRNRVPFANLRFKFPTINEDMKITWPAYLTRYSETFSPEYGAQEAFGRSDKIPIYKGTTRKISLGFTIPNYDSTDANENMKKLNSFLRALYPSYKELGTGARVITSPPLSRIKFANLIRDFKVSGRGLLGYITGLNVNFNLEKYGNFMDSGLIGEGALYPRIFDMSFEFNVLHEDTVGWNSANPGKFGFAGGKGRDYPYATKLSADDVVSLFTGGADGNSVSFDEILGG